MFLVLALLLKFINEYLRKNMRPEVDCRYSLYHIGAVHIRIAAIQRFFRNKPSDHWSGEKSFLYGMSMSKQRIEAWRGKEVCRKRTVK